MTINRHNAASNVHDPRGIGKHNVSHLIYVTLIAPNTSVYPTAIVCSNHEPMNQSYTVSTEAVCPSRKTTLCSSPCTTSSNITNMSKSTSDKLTSKALKTIKQPRKVLKIAHINISSLRNKAHEVKNLLVTDDIGILTIFETHLDSTFDDTVVAIHGYNIYRKDSNASRGGVAVYIQNHIPVKLRDNLMLTFLISPSRIRDREYRLKLITITQR